MHMITKAIHNGREYDYAGGGGGLPLFSLLWSPLGLAEPGFLDISRDNGLLSRAAFPEAWAKIERAADAGLPSVVDDATWLAEKTANGLCGKFSTGDGATTFRIPLLRKRVSLAADDVTDITHGPIIIYTPLLKMYGAIDDPAALNAASAVQQIAAKLDTSAYEEWKAGTDPMRVKAWAEIGKAPSSGSGFVYDAITLAVNVASLTKVSTGRYSIAFINPVPLPYTVLITPRGNTAGAGGASMTFLDDTATATGFIFEYRIGTALADKGMSTFIVI